MFIFSNLKISCTACFINKLPNKCNDKLKAVLSVKLKAKHVEWQIDKEISRCLWKRNWFLMSWQQRTRTFITHVATCPMRSLRCSVPGLPPYHCPSCCYSYSCICLNASNLPLAMPLLQSTQPSQLGIAARHRWPGIAAAAAAGAGAGVVNIDGSACVFPLE